VTLQDINNRRSRPPTVRARGKAGLPATPFRAPRPGLKPLELLRPYVLRHMRVALLALVSLVLASGAMLALPYGIREMIDRGFSPENKDVINIYFGSLVAVGALLAAASAMRFYCVSWLGERVIADLRADVFSHLTRLSPAFYERTHSGEIMSRLTADTTQIKAAVSTSVSQVLRNGVMVIGATGAMIATSLKLSLLVVIVIPLIVVPLILYGRTVRRYSRVAQDEVAASSAFASENLAAVRTMQAFTSEALVSARFAKAVKRSFDAAVSRTSRRAMLTASAIFLIFGSVVCVLWYGAHDVMSGTMSGGALTQFVLYSVFAAAAIGELSEVWGELQAAAGAAGRLAELMAVAPEIREPREPRPFAEHARGEVSFENVCFSYPLRPQSQALHNVSFIVRPGERVAIVGPSGAGKSTIFNLILRFYDPQSGTVFIDRVPAGKAGLEALRKRISLVSQDTIIFAESVIDNIRYGSPDASDVEVKAAARAALASTFIEQLPEGYDTLLGERGVVLSGGQRQRIAIARALLKDAPILLLDEATSALDQESEKLVQTALDRVMRGRTTLVIAHRLATVINADRILVIDDGYLVEEGTHASLIHAGGVYAKLAEPQLATPESTALAS
jgi:ATP-binding cassette, subfamily B, bacterial